MLQNIRDLAIIIMAVETIVVLFAVLILIWQVWKLVGLVRGKFDVITDTTHEILDTVKEMAQTTAKTAHHAEGTAEFVADRTARPVIELYSAIAGAQKFAQAVFRRKS